MAEWCRGMVLVNSEPSVHHCLNAVVAPFYTKQSTNSIIVKIEKRSMYVTCKQLSDTWQ